jgi:hypothetical protein
MSFEASELKKKERYEFWVTASTIIGEGQPSKSVSLSPSSRGGFSESPLAYVMHITDPHTVLLLWQIVKLFWETSVAYLSPVCRNVLCNGEILVINNTTLDQWHCIDWIDLAQDTDQ